MEDDILKILKLQQLRKKVQSTEDSASVTSSIILIPLFYVTWDHQAITMTLKDPNMSKQCCWQEKPSNIKKYPDAPEPVIEKDIQRQCSPD
jgi:hypothetical protein